MADKKKLLQIEYIGDKNQYDFTEKTARDESLQGLEIFYSTMDRGWSFPGRKCLDFKDDGNGVVIQFGIGLLSPVATEVRLDYSELELLEFLMQRISKYKKDKSHFTVLTVEEEK